MKDRLVWMDLEMTGLEPRQDKIIEISVLVTDGELNVVAEGPNIVVHQSDEILDNMNAWCRKYHGNSGLTDMVKKSEISEDAACREVLSFLKKHVVEGNAPLCGNSIGQDKAFLSEYMPEIVEYLHYRVVDVSTIKELAGRWYGKASFYQKKNTHRALDDILESIEELKHYRGLLFKDRL